MALVEMWIESIELNRWNIVHRWESMEFEHFVWVEFVDFERVEEVVDHRIDSNWEETIEWPTKINVVERNLSKQIQETNSNESHFQYNLNKDLVQVIDKFHVESVRFVLNKHVDNVDQQVSKEDEQLNHFSTTTNCPTTDDDFVSMSHNLLNWIPTTTNNLDSKLTKISMNSQILYPTNSNDCFRWISTDQFIRSIKHKRIRKKKPFFYVKPIEEK